MAALESISYLDRRLEDTSSGVSAAYAGGVTTWTLPYSVAVDGTEGTLSVTLQGALQILTTTRPAANQIAAGGDYATHKVYIGVLYPKTYIPSTIFKRDSNGNPDIHSRLNLHHVTARFTESTNLSIAVRRTVGATSVTRRAYTRGRNGELKVKVGAKNDQARIEITDLSPGATALTGLVWTGEYFPRARPV